MRLLPWRVMGEVSLAFENRRLGFFAAVVIKVPDQFFWLAVRGSRDVVDEGSNWLDRDPDFVAALQGEGVGRDDAGAGHQETAVGKSVLAKQPPDERRQRTFDSADRRFAGEHRGPSATDLDGDPGLG